MFMYYSTTVQLKTVLNGSMSTVGFYQNVSTLLTSFMYADFNQSVTEVTIVQ